MPYWVVDHRHAPPHGISSLAITAVEDARLTHAVVMMNDEFTDATGNRPNYKYSRNTMWLNDFPLQDGNIVFLAQISGWKKRVCDVFPDRSIYYFNDVYGDYSLYEHDCTSM